MSSTNLTVIDPNTKFSMLQQQIIQKPTNNHHSFVPSRLEARDSDQGSVPQLQHQGRRDILPAGATRGDHYEITA